MSEFRLLMLSAMYENGGNTVHRFLDGHPELFVYPFESQLGTRYVQDHLSSAFPLKYRWPEFLAGSDPRSDYQAIIDEECKVRSRTPHVSKFRHMPFDFSDNERAALFCRRLKDTERSRGANVEAFFRATFDAWKDFDRSDREHVYVGYSPVVVVDAEKILADLPGAHILHVVRNPWSAYADTKKRPVPLGLATYMTLWSLNQYFALVMRGRYPERVHILRVEDVMADPAATLGGLLEKIGLSGDEALSRPTWNGTELAEVYPWGTLRKVTPEVNRETAELLMPEETRHVTAYAEPYLEALRYSRFLQ